MTNKEKSENVKKNSNFPINARIYKDCCTIYHEDFYGAKWFNKMKILKQIFRKYKVPQKLHKELYPAVRSREIQSIIGNEEHLKYYKIITDALDVESPQKTALEYRDEKDNKFMVKYTNYKYGSYKDVDSFIDALLECPSDKRHFYELLNNDVKLYADIEMETELKDIESGLKPSILIQKMKYLKTFIELIESACNHFKMPFKIDELKILDSSAKTETKEKISFHFVLNNGYVFKHTKNQLFFWNYINKKIIDDDDLLEYRRILTNPSGDFSKESVIDLSVYSNHRAFRTIYSTKQGTQRYLIPVQINSEKTELKEIKQGKFNIKDYITYSPNNKYYEDEFRDTLTQKLISQDRAKRVFMDKKTTIEYIISHSLKDWSFLTTRAGFYILQRTSKDAVCACGIVHPTQNKSYIFTKNNKYIWKCYNDDKYKIIYENQNENAKDDNGIEYYYTYYKILMKKANTIDEVDKYLEETFVNIDNEHSLILKKIKKIAYLSCDVLNSKREVSYYTYDTCNPDLIFCRTKNFEIRIKWEERCKYIKPIVSAFASDIKKLKKLKKDLSELNGVARYVPIGNLFNFYMKRGLVIKMYNQFEFIPTRNNDYLEKKSIFNKFQNFYFENKIPTKEFDFEKSEVFELLTRGLCSSNPKVVEYVIKWIAHLIQKPNKKPDVALCFYSSPGTGKSLLSIFLMNLIGVQYCMINESDKSLEKFNKSEVDKLLMIFEEPKEARVHSQWQQLKQMITRRTIQVRPMFGEKYQQFAYERYWFNMNDISAIKVDANDRRLMINKCSDCFKSDFNFFERVDNLINNKDFLISAFNYFKSIDLSQYEPRNFPETKYKTLEKEQQLNSVYSFLNDFGIELCKDPKERVILEDYPISKGTKDNAYRFSISNIYSSYKKWIELNGVTKIQTQKYVKSKLLQLDLEFNTRLKIGKNKYNGFKFTIEKLRDCFRTLFQNPSYEFLDNIKEDDDDVEVETQLNGHKISEHFLQDVDYNIQRNKEQTFIRNYAFDEDYDEKKYDSNHTVSANILDMLKEDEKKEENNSKTETIDVATPLTTDNQNNMDDNPNNIDDNPNNIDDEFYDSDIEYFSTIDFDITSDISDISTKPKIFDMLKEDTTKEDTKKEETQIKQKKNKRANNIRKYVGEPLTRDEMIDMVYGTHNEGDSTDGDDY